MCLAAVIMLFCATALAAENITTTVVMRVSKMTQKAVVNQGEELSMDVNIEGVVPDSYQWYFNDVQIDGATEKVYHIVNAQTEDTGTYRLDAFDENGNMLASTEIAARVIDTADVPQTGDRSFPVEFAILGMALCAGLIALLLKSVRAR